MKDKDAQLLWEAYTSKETLNEEDDVKLTPFEADRIKKALAAKKLSNQGPLAASGDKKAKRRYDSEEIAEEESHMDGFEVMNMMVEKGIEYVKKYGNTTDGDTSGAIKEIEEHFLKFIEANQGNFDDPGSLIAYIEDENLAHDIQNAMGGEDQYIDDALDF